VLRKVLVSALGQPTYPWYASGLRFSCRQCGRCCSGAPGYVWVTEAEAALIAQHCGLGLAEFARTHLRQVGSRRSLLEKAGGDCDFLERLPDGGTRCAIHPVRPTQCRTWPFWKSNLGSPESWRQAARHCPGIDAGPCDSLEIIEQALNAGASLPL
jgi:Fe-S-cluster containining protein